LDAKVIAKRGQLPSVCYAAAADAGLVRRDATQLSALAQLDRLSADLERYARPPPPAAAAGSSGLGGWLGAMLGIRAAASPPPPAGLYMHGGVGVGKSFAMDLFFECCALPAEAKRRVHFHAFMLDVHRSMHARRTTPDPLGAVAAEIARDTTLLCVDEFQVTDIADALVMRRLFGALFAAGTVVVATSNRAPEDLYAGGLQRDLFLPFVPELRRACVVHDLASSTDYRLLNEASQGAIRTFIHPLGAEADALVGRLWRRLAKGDDSTSMVLMLRGRELHVPRASRHTAVARFGFAELCARPLGAEDFLALAGTFHTLFITDVPRMGTVDVNRARRFITLIDALYERRVKVVVSAAAPPTELYEASPDSGDEVFAFDRTVSRLTEMQSREYLMQSTRQASITHGVEHEAALLFEQRAALSEPQVRRLWERYDVDGDGLIDARELLLLLEDLRERAVGHRNVLPEELAALLARLDRDNSGSVDQSEFFAYFNGRSMGKVARKWLGGNMALDEPPSPAVVAANQRS
jgi:predicted ATPase